MTATEGASTEARQERRVPREFTALVCECERASGMLLTFSRERGFFEPITNQDAEPVVGAVLSWEYDHAQD